MMGFFMLVNTKLAYNAVGDSSACKVIESKGFFIVKKKGAFVFRHYRKNKEALADQAEVCVKSTSGGQSCIDLLFLRPSSPLQNFAKEFLISDVRELDENYIRTELKKAGGANYDAQAE